MKQLATLVVFIITIIPMLILAVIVSPFGLTDDVADNYSNWLTDRVCNCRESE